MKNQQRPRSSKQVALGDLDASNLNQVRYKLLSLPKHPATENERNRTLVHLASIYWGKGDYGSAIDIWQQQIKAAEAEGNTTALAMLYAALAGTYAHSGDAATAIDHAKRALVYEPRNTQALFALASAYDFAGHYENSLRWARRLLSFEPGHAFVHEHIGAIHYRRAEYDQAEKFLRRSLELDPVSITALNELGNMYIALERFEEALAQFDKAQRIQRDEPNAYNNRGNCYLKMGRWAEARRNYEQRIKLYPLDAFSAHIGMGLLERLKPTPQARQQSDAHFRQALAIHESKEARLLARLLEHEARHALALTGLGDEGAVAAWQTVLADPQMATVGLGACSDWFFIAQHLAQCPHPPPQSAAVVALLTPVVEKFAKR